jgi:hypothetical protein
MNAFFDILRAFFRNRLKMCSFVAGNSQICQKKWGQPKTRPFSFTPTFNRPEEMRITYSGPTGESYIEELEAVELSGILLHATPESSVDQILKEGLRTGMPAVKNFTDLQAIFCTIPSENPSTADLFRFYEDWSVLVIDADLLPDHLWYRDFLAAEEAEASGVPNRHVITFQDIPPEAVVKVLTPGR